MEWNGMWIEIEWNLAMNLDFAHDFMYLMMVLEPWKPIDKTFWANVR